MASTRSLLLLGLLVVSFCAAANAGRSLTETNKLSVGDLGGDVDQLLDGLLQSSKGLINLELTVNLEGLQGLVQALELILEDVLGGAVTYDLVEGVVTKLKVIKVNVSVDGLLNIRVVVGGKAVVISLKLTDLGPVVNLVDDIVGAVLTIVETVLDGVHVLQILGPLGEVLYTIKDVL